MKKKNSPRKKLYEERKKFYKTKMNAPRSCTIFFSSCVIVMGEKDKFSPRGGQALLKKMDKKNNSIFFYNYRIKNVSAGIIIIERKINKKKGK